MRVVAMIATTVAAAVLPQCARAQSPSLGPGHVHSLAVHADGTVRSWGSDAHGSWGSAAVSRTRHRRRARCPWPPRSLPPGNPVWYLAVGEQSADGQSFNGTWLSFGNGMTLAGPWRPHALTKANVAPLGINFSAPDAATMTLPNGRTTALRRHRF